ncbi:hypothetical protein SAMN04487780_11644 [Bacillus thuringiensis]|nr:hypothetical protein SAMN04487780_11644 [Bacillus thuringiensis]
MIARMWKSKWQLLILLFSLIVSVYFASLIKEYPEMGISVKKILTNMLYMTYQNIVGQEKEISK